MASRQRVRVTDGAAGDPAMASDVPSPSVGAARGAAQRLKAFRGPDVRSPAQCARPVAETGAP